MSDISKEAVDALLQGVTDGPWVDASFVDDEGEPIGIVAPSDVPFCDQSWRDYGNGYISNRHACFDLFSDGYRSDAETLANARFIAAARELVPALRAALDEAHAAADYLTEHSKKVEARAERLVAAMIQMRDDRTGFRHAVHFRRFITAALTPNPVAASQPADPAVNAPDYRLAPHLQRIVDGAKTAPQWDTVSDRMAAPDPAAIRDAAIIDCANAIWHGPIRDYGRAAQGHELTAAHKCRDTVLALAKGAAE